VAAGRWLRKARRAAAAGRRPRAGSRERVGPRLPVVAGPHGALPAPARREADAVLARPLRHGRPGHAAHAPPEQGPARPCARSLPQAPRGRHHRPRDAALPLAGRLRQGRAKRELRARADGALHPGRRLHRARRARGGARADRLSRELGRRRVPGHLLRPGAPRRGRQADLRQARALRLARRHRPRHRPPAPCAVPRGQAVELVRHRAAVQGQARGAGAHLPPRRPAPQAGGGSDPRRPRPLRGPRRPRHGQGARGLRGRDAAQHRARRHHRRVDLAQRVDGPAALRPALGRRLGLGPGVDVVQHGEDALHGRQLVRAAAADRRARRRRGSQAARRRTARGGPARYRPPVGLAGDAQGPDRAGGALLRRPHRGVAAGRGEADAGRPPAAGAAPPPDHRPRRSAASTGHAPPEAAGRSAREGRPHCHPRAAREGRS
jgi:hypothetical protein